MKAKNKHAVYGCINYQNVFCLVLIEKQSICIQEDIYKVIKDLQTILAKDTCN